MGGQTEQNIQERKKIKERDIREKRKEIIRGNKKLMALRRDYTECSPLDKKTSTFCLLGMDFILKLEDRNRSGKCGNEDRYDNEGKCSACAAPWREDAGKLYQANLCLFQIIDNQKEMDDLYHSEISEAKLKETTYRLKANIAVLQDKLIEMGCEPPRPSPTNPELNRPKSVKPTAPPMD